MGDDAREILESFVVETQENIRRATDYILLIEEQRDEEAINGVFRMFHTVKGNARMVGIAEIGELAHRAEDVIARLRNDTLKPSKQVIDLLLASLDTIELLATASLNGTAPPVAIGPLIEALSAVATGSESPQNALIARLHALDSKRGGRESPAGSGHESNEATEPRRRGSRRGIRDRSLAILVVEDDFITRKTLVTVLKEYGDCDIAVDGKEAVAAFASALDEKPYDLICMDIMMPEMDGFEAVRQIRSAEMIDAVRRIKKSAALPPAYSRKDAVVIMTSALDDPEHYINACYRCGANAYLIKPIGEDAIRSALLRFNLIGT